VGQYSREGEGGGAKPAIGRCILRTACGKRPVYGMKLDVINGEHQGLIFPAWRLVFSMTSEGIVLPGNRVRSQKE
jgi:hypothetical protein